MSTSEIYFEVILTLLPFNPLSKDQPTHIHCFTYQCPLFSCCHDFKLPKI